MATGGDKLLSLDGDIGIDMTEPASRDAPAPAAPQEDGDDTMDVDVAGKGAGPEEEEDFVVWEIDVYFTPKTFDDDGKTLSSSKAADVADYAVGVLKGNLASQTRETKGGTGGSLIPSVKRNKRPQYCKNDAEDSELWVSLLPTSGESYRNQLP